MECDKTILPFCDFILIETPCCQLGRGTTSRAVRASQGRAGRDGMLLVTKKWESPPGNFCIYLGM